jgi:hypothetical protein
MSVMTDRTGAATFTIGVGELQADDTLVIETSVGQSFSMIHLGVAGGTVAPCEAVDAPAPPVGTGGNGSGPANNTGSDTGPGTDVHAG